MALEQGKKEFTPPIDRLRGRFSEILGQGVEKEVKLPDGTDLFFWSDTSHDQQVPLFKNFRVDIEYPGGLIDDRPIGRRHYSFEIGKDNELKKLVITKPTIKIRNLELSQSLAFEVEMKNVGRQKRRTAAVALVDWIDQVMMKGKYVKSPISIPASE